MHGKETAMLVQVHTDNHIDGNQRLFTYVTSLVEDTFAELADRITRVEVHLNDVNSDKKEGVDDKRCMMEARLGGLPPFAATATGATLDQAIDAACDKLHKVIEHHLGRLKDRHGRISAAGEQIV